MAQLCHSIGSATNSSFSGLPHISHWAILLGLQFYTQATASCAPAWQPSKDQFLSIIYVPMVQPSQGHIGPYQVRHALPACNPLYTNINTGQYIYSAGHEPAVTVQTKCEFSCETADGTQSACYAYPNSPTD